MSDERQAEMEAVARELWPGAEGGPIWPSALRRSEKVIAALDRVRDARGDDEGLRLCEACGKHLERELRQHDDEAARPPQDEDDEAGTPYCDVCRCYRPAGQCGFELYGQERPKNCPQSSQSEAHERVVDPEITAEERQAREAKMLAPQGEDHEAELYVREWLERWRVSVAPTSMVREFIAGFPSPSRDGSVAVEEVAEWLENRASLYRENEFALDASAATTLRAAARNFLAEFSPASSQASILRCPNCDINCVTDPPGVRCPSCGKRPADILNPEGKGIGERH